MVTISHLGTADTLGFKGSQAKGERYHLHVVESVCKRGGSCHLHPSGP